MRCVPVLSFRSRDSTGNYTFQNGPQPYVDILGNPVAAAVYNTDKGSNIRLLTNMYGEYEPISGLRLRANVGGELLNYREDVFRPTTTYLGNSSNGYAGVNTNNNYDWLSEFTATYDKTWGIHAITLLGGWTYQEWKYRSASATGTNPFVKQLRYRQFGRSRQSGPPRPIHPRIPWLPVLRVSITG